MKYRLEFSICGVENGWIGEKDFEAVNDEEAVSKIEQILKSEKEKLNKNIENRFWHYSIRDPRLIKVEQPEISSEVETSLQKQNSIY